jgi:hypothetical protein
VVAFKGLSVTPYSVNIINMLFIIM